MTSRIRLMTHNVWNKDFNSPEWEQKGENCAAHARVDGLLRVYRETMPDIIGGQEVSARMADLMKEGFAEAPVNYILIWGRFTPILYRADKFELVDSAFGTYPEEMPGFEGSFNDVKSKSWNLGVFRIKENGNLFIFATTHLWWKKSPSDTDQMGNTQYQSGSDEARAYQISLLAEKIRVYREKYQCAAVLVGDLNTGYSSQAVRYLMANGFRHAHDIATEYAEESIGYHDCFPWGYKTEYYDAPFESAIDHIFVIGEEEGAVKRFERYSPDYYFPISDHSAAYIDVEF